MNVAASVHRNIGYIEEWSNARVLRDAHLGSIWEGTSNIVALDVARATRREGALDALLGYLDGPLAEVDDTAGDRAALGAACHRAASLMRRVASERGAEAHVRLAASALYNATSAVILAWEAGRIATGDWRRRDLARMVLAHKLTPRDPLAVPAEDAAVLERLLETHAGTAAAPASLAT